MAKQINIREELNKRDMESCETDFVNMYEALNLSDGKKKELVKLLSEDADNSAINKFLLESNEELVVKYCVYDESNEVLDCFDTVEDAKGYLLAEGKPGDSIYAEYYFGTREEEPGLYDGSEFVCDYEDLIYSKLQDKNLYEPTEDTPVYEVNTLKDSGEIEASNTCNTLASAIKEYNDLGSVDKELVKHSLENGEDKFDEVASFFTADNSGKLTIEDSGLNEDVEREEAPNLDELANKIQEVCRERKIGLSEIFVHGMFITAYVEGDWKHDHWYFEDTVKEIYPNVRMGKKQIGETDSDWYEAEYTILAHPLVDDFAKLFAPVDESVEGDQIAQDAIDSKNANFEKDKQATRDMRQELAKNGIATDVDGKPITESRESELPDSVIIDLTELDYDNEDELYDAITEYLSDTYGFCLFGYDVDDDYNEPNKIKVVDIDWDTSDEELDESAHGGLDRYAYAVDPSDGKKLIIVSVGANTATVYEERDTGDDIEFGENFRIDVGDLFTDYDLYDCNDNLIKSAGDNIYENLKEDVSDSEQLAKFKKYCEGKIVSQDELGFEEVEDGNGDSFKREVVMIGNIRNFGITKVLRYGEFEDDEVLPMIKSDGEYVESPMITVPIYAARMEFSKISEPFYNEMVKYWADLDMDDVVNDGSLKEDTNERLQDGDVFNYKDHIFELYYLLDDTDRLDICCDTIVYDNSDDLPVILDTVSSDATKEDVMKIIANNYDNLIAGVESGEYRIYSNN